MNFPLLPAIILEKLTQLTPDFLQKQKIRLLMLDFDNTIVPYTTNVPSEEVKGWFQEMQQMEIQLCVVSNSRNSRVQEFCEQYGLECITHAKKPSTGGIRRCMEKFGAQPSDCGLVGDQIFTDTLGANLAGVRPILVNAIDNHNIWLKLRHVAELPFIFAARKRRVNL